MFYTLPDQSSTPQIFALFPFQSSRNTESEGIELESAISTS